MKIVVVGGTTPLGQRLIRALCESVAAAEDAPAEQILSLDVVRPSSARSRLFVDDRLGYVNGDAAEPAWLSHVMGYDTTSVFVLAHALLRDDADAELRATVDATRALLEACRGRARGVDALAAHAFVPQRALTRFVFVCDRQAAHAPAPAQRARRVLIARLLVGEYADRGLIDGRIVELPEVVELPENNLPDNVEAFETKEQAPDAAGAGAWLAWAIGETVAGRPVACPNDGWPWNLISVDAAVRAIVWAHGQAATDWQRIAERARHAAGIRVSAPEWVEAIQAMAPPAIAACWSIAPRPASTGESALDFARASSGAGAGSGASSSPGTRDSGDELPGDADLAALIRACLAQVVRHRSADPEPKS